MAADADPVVTSRGGRSKSRRRAGIPSVYDVTNAQISHRNRVAFLRAVRNLLPLVVTTEPSRLTPTVKGSRYSMEASPVPPIARADHELGAGNSWICTLLTCLQWDEPIKKL
jgi:hypothetical protein